ncbi:MAG: ATP synthase subunit I [Smithella sp.]|nr:ATP synthase subunit I [Smithella sp.]
MKKMMMHSNLNLTFVFALTASFALGLVLGAFYFLGLWRTVKKMAASEHPVRLMVGSFAVRMIIVLTAFYFIMGGQWERLTAALIGFVAMKMLLTRRLGVKGTAEIT